MPEIKQVLYNIICKHLHDGVMKRQKNRETIAAKKAKKFLDMIEEAANEKNY